MGKWRRQTHLVSWVMKHDVSVTHRAHIVLIMCDRHMVFMMCDRHIFTHHVSYCFMAHSMTYTSLHVMSHVVSRLRSSRLRSWHTQLDTSCLILFHDSGRDTHNFTRHVSCCFTTQVVTHTSSHIMSHVVSWLTSWHTQLDTSCLLPYAHAASEVRRRNTGGGEKGNEKKYERWNLCFGTDDVYRVAKTHRIPWVADYFPQKSH